MSGGLYLTRAHLADGAKAREFLSAAPTSRGDSPCALGHHLVWTLFDGGKRDFLWSQDAKGFFWVLSERHPSDSGGVLGVLPPKRMPDTIPSGVRLEFSLCANAVRRTRESRGERRRKHDVVMDELRRMNKWPRASARRIAIQDAGWQWLSRQAERSGFSVDRDEL